jgi:hypothetical protein
MAPKLLSGAWWLPEHPDNAQRGQLQVDVGERLTLELHGALTQFDGELGLQREAVWGLSSSGKKVSLLRAREVNRQLNSSGLETSRVTAEFVVIGAHCPSLEEYRVKKLRVRFSDLEEWAWLSGFKFTLKNTPESNTFAGYTLDYETPVDLPIDINNATLRFVHSFQADGGLTFAHSLSQKTYWELEFPEPQLLEPILHRELYHLQNFMSLAAGRAVHPLEVEGVFPAPEGEPDLPIDPSRVTTVHFRSRGAPKEDYKRLHPAQMFFSLPQIRDIYASVVRTWLEKSEELRPVVDLYFSTLFAPGQYSESRFLSLAQALETYHRTRIGGTYLSVEAWTQLKLALLNEVERREAPNDAKAALKGKLEYLNEVSLRRRLRDLVGRMGQLANLMIPEGNSFVGLVVDTRNYLTHYDPSLAERRAQGRRLYLLAEQMKYALEVLLLQELRLDSDRIVQIMANSQHYQHWARELRV